MVSKLLSIQYCTFILQSSPCYVIALLSVAHSVSNILSIAYCVSTLLSVLWCVNILLSIMKCVSILHSVAHCVNMLFFHKKCVSTLLPVPFFVMSVPGFVKNSCWYPTVSVYHNSQYHALSVNFFQFLTLSVKSCQYHNVLV